MATNVSKDTPESNWQTCIILNILWFW